jgi:ubiquinone/menaquinone biosynthesis C-methylase UbiE
MTGAPGFDLRAARYDELRPVDDNWWEVFVELVRLGELHGVRVLEVGCGTGRLSAALEARELARVWAVDASEAMVARARENGVNAKAALAEALPFKAGWFDAVVMRMVVHLTDRTRAFTQAARVLGPNGRLAIATEDPASFDRVWFARYFPSVPAIDRARFPDEDTLREELAAAGLPSVRIERRSQRREQSREKALEVIRAKAFSTFDLLPPDEYANGLARAEAELPESFEYSFDWLLAVATR